MNKTRMKLVSGNWVSEWEWERFYKIERERNWKERLKGGKRGTNFCKEHEKWERKSVEHITKGKIMSHIDGKVETEKNTEL